MYLSSYIFVNIPLSKPGFKLVLLLQYRDLEPGSPAPGPPKRDRISFVPGEIRVKTPDPPSMTQGNGKAGNSARRWIASLRVYLWSVATHPAKSKK